MDANQPTPVTSDTATLQSLATGGQQEAWVPRMMVEADPSIPHRQKVQWGSQERFLIAYGLIGTATHACAQAEVSYEAYKSWVRDNPQDFKARLENAREEFNSNLEVVLFNRVRAARAGVDQTLVIFALNGNMPHKYKLAPASDDQAIASKQTLAELKRLKLAKAKDAVD
jgi:hypothetical protein